jgi:hypothetical protein
VRQESSKTPAAPNKPANFALLAKLTTHKGQPVINPNTLQSSIVTLRENTSTPPTLKKNSMNAGPARSGPAARETLIGAAFMLCEAIGGSRSVQTVCILLLVFFRNKRKKKS